jgi:hypothetical protein
MTHKTRRAEQIANTAGVSSEAGSGKDPVNRFGDAAESRQTLGAVARSIAAHAVGAFSLVLGFCPSTCTRLVAWE